jgi:hypothetical protein
MADSRAKDLVARRVTIEIIARAARSYWEQLSWYIDKYNRPFQNVGHYFIVLLG